MFEQARVVEVDWKSCTVNLVMSDGRPVSGVRIMSNSASTNTGLNDIPRPDVPTGKSPQAGGGFTKTRDILALVAFINGNPIVFGFLHPVGSQMMMTDEERMVYRHASDVYHTIDKDGNIEIKHPGGAYVRFGTSSAHEDLTGKSRNGNWKITRNTTKQVHIHIEQAGGVASVDIAPNGAITVNSAVSLTITAPTTTVNGVVHVTGDVVAGFGGQNVSLLSHVHGAVTPGPGNTGAPV